MRSRRLAGRMRGRGWAALVMLVCVAAVAVASGTQDQGQDESKPQDPPKAKQGSKKKTGGLRVPVGPVPKGRRAPAADPLAPPANAANAGAAVANDNAAAKGKAAAADARKGQAQPGAGANANAARPPQWPFHYTMRIGAADGTPVAASYYPARETFEAPVVLLIHETGAGRSGKDFSEPIDEFKGKSFAAHLQEQGYAVLVIDLRGHGGNARRELAPQDWRLMVDDLQSAYTFLIDRHNRGEFNLAKFGVVALGDGANLAVAWAASSAGGVSSEGRLSDIGALALISPVAETPGMRLDRVLAPIATRFPLLVLCGDRDQASVQAARDNQRVIERHRLSRVQYFDSSLHGGKLLAFFPKVAVAVERFLDDPVKNRKVDWEPRFLLEPVGYDVVELVPDSGFVQGGLPRRPAAAEPKAKAEQPAEKKAR